MTGHFAEQLLMHPCLTLSLALAISIVTSLPLFILPLLVVGNFFLSNVAVNVCVNVSATSITSSNLRDCTRVMVQTRNTPDIGVAALVTEVTGISITSGAGKTFPPAKSFHRINETPLICNWEL